MEDKRRKITLHISESDDQTGTAENIPKMESNQNLIAEVSHILVSITKDYVSNKHIIVT